jgi:pimeloyl-ACP methyl ester carboxylesterase
VPSQADQELRALSRLASGEIASLPGGIGAVHAAVAARVFGALGPVARPVRLWHEGVARGVYAGVGGGLNLAGRAAGEVLARRSTAQQLLPLSTTPRGSAVIAAVNGLVGDVLEREGSALATPAAVRVGGEPVAPRADALAAAFPGATPRLAVFVHGLGETEFAWRLGGEPPYGKRLASELGYTAVYVRLNSGRHVSENGRSLDELLDAVVAEWPVPVERIALVGHSMGGLIARSACHHGAERGARWTGAVRNVTSLGTPHFGAPLEQGVHMASAALHAVPETRPLARWLRRRSAGIRDLRHGSLVDADWLDADPDALRARATQEVPLLDGATHCFVAATITRSPSHPLGRLLGDALVLAPSASGRNRKRRLAFTEGYDVGGAHHLALLNHPEVYAQLRRWLEH